MRTLFALVAVFVLPLFVCLAEDTPITGTHMDLEFAGADVGFLPTDGDALAGTTHPLGGVILLGGDGADGPLVQVCRVDARTGEVTSLPELPEPRSGAAAGTWQGRVYAIGGRNGDKLLSRVDVWSPGEEAWSAGPALPNALVGAACISNYDGLFVIGGHDGKKARNEVLKLGKDRRDRWTWETIGKLKHARRNHAAVKLPDGRFIVIGGAGDNGALASCEYFDGKKPAEAPALPAACDDMVAGIIYYPGEELVVLPGLKGKDAQTPLRLNAGLKVWEPKPDWARLACSGAVGVAAGGKLLTAGGRDHEGNRLAGVRSFGWDAEFKSRALIIHPGEGNLDYRALAISPDGKQFVTSCAASRLEFRDMETGNVLRSAELPHSGRGLAWSPDSKHVAVLTNWWKSALIFDAQTLASREIEFEIREPRYIDWSPDGKLIAIAGAAAARMSLFDARTGAELHALTGHTSTISAVQFMPDSKQLVSSAKDGTLRTWDVTTGKESSKIAFGETLLMGMAVSPDGKLAAVGDRECNVLLVDLADGKVLATRPLHSRFIQSLAFDASGRFLVSGAQDDERKLGFDYVLWSVENLQPVHFIRSGRGEPYPKFARFHPTRPVLYVEATLAIEIVDLKPANERD